MDRFGQHLAPSLDELKQIQTEVRNTNSLAQLRTYFERVQELRRIHSGNFDVQILVAEAQEEIIERARDLRSRPGPEREDEELFEPPPPASPGFSPPAEDRQTVDDRPPLEEEDALTEDSLGAETRSWRRATLLALVFTAAICVVFFYLIQTARRINLPQPVQTAPPKASQAPKAPATIKTGPVDTAALNGPAVRLYTDLIPGTVSIDEGEPQDLKDGELMLDHLQPGRHSIKVAGRNGSAAFSFDVGANGAPQAVAPLNATGALAVAVSAQDGKGHLLTSAEQAEVTLDAKSLGTANADGLELTNLGTSDHDLQIDQTDDHQHFVLTYTAAPALTFYVKSVFNGGVVTVKANQDGANIFINDKPYRRKTEQGQIRMPLRAGTYTIRLHKDGFTDPAPQTVTVKKGDEPELTYNFEATPAVAYLDVRGAPAGALVLVDQKTVATAAADGRATASGIAPGEHAIELRLDGSQPKRFTRLFEAGKAVSLSGADTSLDKVTKPAETAAAPAPPPAATSVESPPKESAAAGVDVPGEQVRRGGGFLHYNLPRTPGRYTFQAHAKMGGVFKHEKLQWYAGYENSENYVMFSVDGKHATIRQVTSGHSREINRVAFNSNSDGWVQVDMSVQPGSIETRIKTPGGDWTDLGSVSGVGRDLTQGQMGFYLPGNDEVAVSNFHFAPQR